jgi:hypothetical protein
MVDIIRGTTPSLTLALPDSFDFSTVKAFEIWLQSGSSGEKYRFTDAAIRRNEVQKTVTITLTQQQTLNFTNDDILSVQIRYLGLDGSVGASYAEDIKAAKFIGEGEFNAAD